ncbi:NUDIX domain-containing protein [Bacillaceae bacterium Marseille-Q3522]|nr:NUDIX domain-containing protein [Bacillaceae bacterium Marseille-Q3522]
MKINFYRFSEIDDKSLRFAVIAARHQRKWIFVQHKQRNTWEIPGGKREPGEEIRMTAKRKLFEETGAKQFILEPICVYGVDHDEKESFGALYYADVQLLADLPDSEIGKVSFFEEMPENLTYAKIQPFLFEKTVNYLKNREIAAQIINR